MTDRPNRLTYADAGVDIAAGEALVECIKPAARATDRPGVMAGLGGFGGLFDLKAAGFADPVLVAATDGVGTKLRLAIDTGQTATVGIDLVAMCVNDLICQGAEPLFFLDYFATGKLAVEDATRVIEGIAEGCREAGCALIGGETAEMPGMYPPGDFDLAGFAVGAAERDALLPRPTRADDVLIALPSSGVHSNGYSLVRRVVADAGLAWEAACPWREGTLGSALLTPTRIYVRAALAAIAVGGVNAIAHITGGGLTENLPRVLSPGLGAEIDLDAWEVPAVFRWLGGQSGLDAAEALKTFNCGVGLVLAVTPDASGAVESALREAGETPLRIGHLTEGAGVSYRGILW